MLRELYTFIVSGIDLAIEAHQNLGQKPGSALGENRGPDQSIEVDSKIARPSSGTSGSLKQGVEESLMAVC